MSETILVGWRYVAASKIYCALYERIDNGATATVTARTLERAEAEDARLREEGYAPVIRP